jgi:ribonuclease HI
VADSREDSIKQEKEDKAEFKAYSDGSGLNGGIGAAAVLYKAGRFTPVSQLKVFLGTSSKHNTFEVEATGAILAVWLLNRCPETAGKKVTVYIDNQSILSSLVNPKATSGQHLVRHLIMQANNLVLRDLGFRWISSHSKVRGNEKVDELAKEAADGYSSERERLPHLLRNTLPTSASATRQAFHEKVKAKWENGWVESDRSRRIAEIDNNFPFLGFRKRVNALSRSQASLMAQIRCGHFPLNSYLHRINKSETDLCQACLDGEDNLHCRETVRHFLFECSAFRAEREELVGKISRRHLNLHDIMADTNRMRALANFIRKTGRLK